MTTEQLAVKEKLLERVPFELRSALSYMAYEKGHAYGNEEILVVLNNLVSDLEEPLNNLVKRLTGQTH